MTIETVGNLLEKLIEIEELSCENDKKIIEGQNKLISLIEDLGKPTEGGGSSMDKLVEEISTKMNQDLEPTKQNVQEIKNRVIREVEKQLGDTNTESEIESEFEGFDMEDNEEDISEREDIY